MRRRAAGAHDAFRLSAGLLESADGSGRVVSYTNSLGFVEINDVLRTFRGRKVTPAVAEMDRAFDAAAVTLSAPVTVTRGAVFGNEGETVAQTRASVLRAFAPGAEFRDHAFVSTTYDPEVSNTFSRGYGVRTLFEIGVPAGSRVLAGSRMESELILNRGSTFRVRSVSEREDGTVVVSMDLEGGDV